MSFIITILFSILVVLLPFNSAHACTIDEPDCACFTSGGSWNPSGSGTLLDVADETLGTVESCGSNSGKPFWQMVVGINSAATATNSAGTYSGWTRGNWCSEAVAYWHREAGLPYSNGYQNSWYTSWQTYTTDDIRVWYKTEGGTVGGRGRWIDATDLDLEDFELGVTVPCPGAYQQWMGYNASNSDPWSGVNNAHSQVIKSMTIYRKPNGRIVDFDVQMIEGNASNQVQDTTVYTSLPQYTPQGPTFLGNSRKIRGWGIDLNSAGDPRCEAENISYVVVPFEADELKFEAIEPNWHDSDDDQINKNLRFIEALAKTRGPKVSVNGKIDEKLLALMNAANTSPVYVKPGLLHKGNMNILVRYPLPIPYPVGAVEIRFAKNAPQAVALALAVENNKVMNYGTKRLNNNETSVFINLRQPTSLQAFQLLLQPRNEQGTFIEAIYLHPYHDPKFED
ncbi:MAG: hypothetical protein HYU97_11355 [Deltaproteobacteria bacterium]|nr:hypothetical protein [Deltaproteobacteria bacterium]